MLDNLKMETSVPLGELIPESTAGDAGKDGQGRHVEVGSPGTGFFISPLREPRSQSELERAWKDSE